MTGSFCPMMLVAMVIIATALSSPLSGTLVPPSKSTVSDPESSRLIEPNQLAATEGTSMETEDPSHAQDPLPASTGVSKMADDTNMTTVSPSPTARPVSTIPSSLFSPWEKTKRPKSSTQNPSHDATGSPTAPEDSPTANQSEFFTALTSTKMTIRMLLQVVNVKGVDDKTNSTQKPPRPEGTLKMGTMTWSETATPTLPSEEQTKMVAVSSTQKPLQDGGGSPKMAATITVATGSPGPVGKAKTLSTTMTPLTTTGGHLGGMSLRPASVTGAMVTPVLHAVRIQSWVLPVVVLVVLFALVLLAAVLCWWRQQRSGSTSFAGQQWAGPVPLPEEGGVGGGAQQGRELQAGAGPEPGPALSTFKGHSPSAEVAMQELAPATSEAGPAEEATPLLGAANGSVASVLEGDGEVPAPPLLEAQLPV